jgi:hypothetical protein
MKILSNTTRDVEIYTPLKIKSTTATVIDNGLVINGVLKVDEIRMTDTETLPSDGVMITAINGRQLFKVSNENTTSSENLIGLKNIEAVTDLTVGRNAVINGNLTVTGTTSFASANPYWVAVVINYVGGVPTIVRNGGRYAATSLVRVSGQANGTTYIANVTAIAGYGTVYTSSRSSTRFGITTRNISNVLFDTETHVLISAY